MSLKIRLFILITFGFSWLFWLPGVLANYHILNWQISDKVLLLVGALSPILATFYLERNNKGELLSILKRSFNPFVKWQWIVVCLSLPLLMQWFSHYIYTLFEIRIHENNLVENPIILILLFVVMFLIGGGLNEEIGWRNYVLEYYLTRYNALKASVVLSGWWILWHLPLFFMENTNQALIPYWLFVLPVVPLSVMLTWIYNNTKGSIFAVALFHTMGNMSHEIFSVFPVAKSSSLIGFVVLGLVYFIVAIVIVLFFGYKDLTLKTA